MNENQFPFSGEVEMCFDKPPGKDSLCFVCGRWISQNRHKGIERRWQRGDSFSSLSQIFKHGDTEEISKRGLQEMRNSERGRTQSLSLPYFRYLTCPFMNIMDIRVSHFTMKTPRPCEGTERSRSWAFAHLDITPRPASMEAVLPFTQPAPWRQWAKRRRWRDRKMSKKKCFTFFHIRTFFSSSPN